MKKTLIALAAVAAATAASAADFTISGEFSYGFQSYTNKDSLDSALSVNADGARTLEKQACASTAVNCVDVRAAERKSNSGFGIDTAKIVFSASEDLGGGTKLTASMSAGGFGRDNAVEGEDYSIALSSAMGTVMMGTVEIGSGIRGLAQADAPVNNMETEVLAAAKNNDILKVTLPAMNGLTVSASYIEPTGLASGADTTTKAKSSVTVGVEYAVGALKAKFDMSDYNSKSTTIDNRYRVALQYDMGVAKLGAGYESQNLDAADATQKYTMVGLSAPINAALTVGAVYTTSDASATAGTITGYSIGAQYALSKRTNVTANTAKWEVSENASAEKSTKTTVLLNHSF